MSLFDSASLVVTPNGYKEDKLYSIKPTDGSGDLVVTRATTATRVNSAGLIEVVPRNLLEYSNILTNGIWTNLNTTLTLNSIANPINGIVDGYTVSLNSGTFAKAILQSQNQNGTYTQSIYVKANSHNFIQLLVGNDGNPYANFNILNGTLSAFNCTATITSIANGWYRCAITYTTSIGASACYLWAVDSLSASRAAGISSTGSFYAYGFQLEQFGSATEYFPTTDRLDVPRLDYTNSSCPSILVEPQRTNLALYSEQFDNANWNNQAITLTANNTSAPDGNNTADSINISATFGEHNVYSNAFTTTANTDYTFSYFIKKGTGRYAAAAIYYVGAGFGAYATYDLNTNTLVASGAPNGTFTSSKIETFDNGWVRISVTGKGNFTSIIVDVDFRNAANLVPGVFFTGANETFSIWGAQLEAGSYATSYIPTVASSVTRNADVISKTGISSLIGQTEGTIFYDGYFGNNTDEIYLFLQSTGSTSIENSIYLVKDGTGISFKVWVGVTPQVSIQGGTFALGQRIKIAAAYKQNDFSLYINGTQIATDSLGNVPNCSNLHLGTYAGDPTNQIYIANKGINSAQIYKTRLTNSELAQLTTI